MAKNHKHRFDNPAIKMRPEHLAGLVNLVQLATAQRITA